MPNPLIAGIGLSAASGMAQSSAAGKAADAQSQAAADQVAESRRQFDLVRNLLQPYVGAGNTALDAQMSLLGLGPLSMSQGTLPAIETIAGSPGGQASASPIRGGDRGRGVLDGFGGLGVQSQARPDPTRYRVNGQLFNTLDEANAYANQNRTFTNDPNARQTAQQQAIDNLANGAQFQSLVRRGEDAILANASATGGLRGGNTQAALAQFRPQMLQALIDKQLANLGGIAANGQNAAGMTGTAALQTGQQVNAAYGDRGAALAGGALQQGKIFGDTLGGIGSGLGYYMGQTGGVPQGASLFGSWGF